MHTIHGGCYCGNIEISAELTQAPSSYNPRACDCDFCRKHGAAYISDPSGRLHIKLISEPHARRYRQGSGAAEFLLCATCGVLVAVLYRTEQTTYGTVNARAVNEPAPFGETKSVSPKMLPPTDKVERWQKIWFSGVDVNCRD